MSITVRHFLPPPPLEQYVHRFWEVGTSNDSTLRILPDGSWDIVCHVSGSMYTIELVGPMIKAVLIPLNYNTRHYGVRFAPGTYFKSLIKNLSELVGIVIPLDQIVPGVTINTSIPVIPQLLMLVEHMASYGQLERDYAVDIALQTIKASSRSSVPAISDLAKGTSLRTLERRFQRYVGISPKQLLRTYRQLAIVETLLKNKHPSLSRLASDFSYVDQSHMTNDLRLLLGTTPKALGDELGDFLQYDWSYDVYTN